MVELLLTARTLMEHPDLGTTGLWRRAAALLARQELEAALARLWLSEMPGVERASTTTQLRCLDQYVDDDLAADIRSAWSALSRACHHHHYELAPTADELDHWIRQVEHLTTVLEQPHNRR